MTKGTVISLASAKGGVGKTTAAISLLAWLTEMYGGLRIALVDLDPEGYATAMGLGQPLAANPLHATPISVAMRNGRTALLFPGGDATADASERELVAHIQRGAHVADVVLVDTPPTRRSDAVRAALRAAHVIVTPVMPEPQAYGGFTRVLAQTSEMRVTAPVVALFSRWEARTVTARSIHMHMLASPAHEKLDPIVPRDERVVKAMVKAIPVPVAAPDSPASRAYHLAAIELARLTNLGPSEVTL
jgi:septum site-determining protein MinD